MKWPTLEYCNVLKSKSLTIFCKKQAWKIHQYLDENARIKVSVPGVVDAAAAEHEPVHAHPQVLSISLDNGQYGHTDNKNKFIFIFIDYFVILTLNLSL